MAEENLGKAVLALATDDKGLKEGLDSAERHTTDWGGRIFSIIKGAFAIGAIMKVGKDIADFFGSTLAAANDAERVTALLESTLKSTGGASGQTKTSIEALSLALSLVTPIEDDVITGAQSMLLTFKNIGGETFPRATAAILDMATGMNRGAIPSAEQLQGTTIMLGKALNDPIAGMAAMGRAGVQFSEEQKVAIKAMVEMGDLAGAQALILKEVESQFGGAAKAAGTTFAGQMAIANNQIGNVKEAIGGALNKVLSELATQYGPQVITFVQELGNWLITSAIPALKELVKWLGVNLPPVITFLSNAWNTVLLPALREVWRLIDLYLIPALKVIWQWLAENLPPAITGAKKTWEDLQPALKVVNEIFGWIVDALKKVLEGYKTLTAFLMKLEVPNPFQGLLDTINAIVDAAKRAWDALQRLGGKGLPGGGGGGGGQGGQGAQAFGAMRGLGSMTGATAALGAQASYQNTWAITINAPGGDAQQVRRAAEQGVLSAARAMGMR